MEGQKQQIEAIRDYWNQRANGFALAVDEELKLEEAKESFQLKGGAAHE